VSGEAVVLVGVLGFEPRNGGIKIRCLTTWLHPNTSGAENIVASGDGCKQLANFAMDIGRRKGRYHNRVKPSVRAAAPA
jgi:hypothetical protein